MDISNALTLPQLVLTASLFLLLIGWLVIFAYLAVRPERQSEEMEDTAPRTAIKVPVTQTRPVSPRAVSMPPITQPIPIVAVAADPAHEIVMGGGRFEHSSTSSGQI